MKLAVLVSVRFNPFLWMMSAALLLLSLVATAEAQVFVFQVEGGQVTKQDTYTNPVWDTVALQFTYSRPIIFAIANSNGSHPADFRIRNITTTGFEVTLAEPPSEDGPHIAMDVAYVAVEEGLWSLPDGQQMAAGTLSTTQTVWSSGGSWTTVTLPPGFNNPIVVAQLQGQANETANIPSAPSSPWLTVAVRNVTASSFDVALEGSECTLQTVAAPETIGWMAIDGGMVSSFIDSDGVVVDYETIKTPPIVVGWDQGSVPIFFGGSYVDNPLFVARLQTRNEEDGGWARFSSLSASGVSLRVDEDRCLDNERSHVDEEAGLFVFSQSFRIQDPDPDEDGIASSIDNCPLTFNPGQEDGDGDSFGDVCDNCPFIGNPGQEDVDANGVGNSCDCGDALLASGEACDDGDLDLGDGCTPDCFVEPGWVCSGSPSQCTPICGDGAIVSTESCDDGNLTSGDGCSASCRIENGWLCAGEPSSCMTTCGDGIIAGTEQCDDANAKPGDGCDAACFIEQGWTCAGMASKCTTLCGDGFRVRGEACDDGNVDDGDGCSSDCTIESTGAGGSSGGTSSGGGIGSGGAATGGFGGSSGTTGGFGGASGTTGGFGGASGTTGGSSGTTGGFGGASSGFGAGGLSLGHGGRFGWGGSSADGGFGGGDVTTDGGGASSTPRLNERDADTMLVGRACTCMAAGTHLDRTAAWWWLLGAVVLGRRRYLTSPRA